jgi:hypothetical protein
MVQGFTLLLAKFAAVLTWLGNLFKGVFVSLWDIGVDAVCWCLESSMKLAVDALNAFDTSAITSNLGAFGSIPEEALNVLALLGGGQAAAIVGSAIAIRFGMQLIPFVRLGS